MLYPCRTKLFKAGVLMLKVIKKIFDVITSLLVAAAVILVVLLVGVRLFGIEPFTVLSGSMEPRYHVGSVIYVEEVDPRELSVGDALTFTINGTIITHEIINIVDAQNPNDMLFETQGLTNNVSDGNIPVSNIIGRPVYTIPYLGYVAEYVQKPAGLMGIAAVIVILLLISFILDILAGGKKDAVASDNQCSISDSQDDPDESTDEDIKNNKEDKKQ